MKKWHRWIIAGRFNQMELRKLKFYPSCQRIWDDIRGLEEAKCAAKYLHSFFFFLKYISNYYMQIIWLRFTYLLILLSVSQNFTQGYEVCNCSWSQFSNFEITWIVHYKEEVVDSIMVYCLQCQTSELKVVWSNPVQLATTLSKSCLSLTCPMIVLREQPAGSGALMVLNYSCCVVLGSWPA